MEFLFSLLTLFVAIEIPIQIGNRIRRIGYLSRVAIGTFFAVYWHILGAHLFGFGFVLFGTQNSFADPNTWTTYMDLSYLACLHAILLAPIFYDLFVRRRETGG